MVEEDEGMAEDKQLNGNYLNWKEIFFSTDYLLPVQVLNLECKESLLGGFELSKIVAISTPWP